MIVVMRIPLPERFHVLYERNFRLYWGGQLVSLTGMWMQAVAVGFLVLELTGSTFALAITHFAVTVPGLLLALLGGVAADRYDRRWLMVWTQAALMVLALLTGGGDGHRL
jgi:MFS family permease